MSRKVSASEGSASQGSASQGSIPEGSIPEDSIPEGSIPEVPGFTTSEHTALGLTHVVYRRGEGPPVVVMHEIPGITPAVARFARRVADEGFTVVMPWLFGTPNRTYSKLYAAEQIARSCVSREINVWARNESSPITDWLRDLSRTMHEETGLPVGAIGMCVTGNFALALMVDEHLMAPVLAQPSLPYGATRAQLRGLHVSDEQLVTIKRRVAEGVGVLGMRFSHDMLCRRPRFDRLQEELGEGFEQIEIDSGPGNEHGISRTAHSVVAKDFIDREGHPTREALDRVLAFFRERLLTS